MLAGEAGNGPRGHRGAVAEGFSVMIDECGEIFPEIIAYFVHDQGEAAFFGDGFGVGELGEFGFIKGDAETLHGAGKDAAHFQCDEGGIDAAGEEHAEGDIGNEMGVHGFMEDVFEFFLPLLIGAVFMWGDFPLPVTERGVDAAVQIEGDRVAGGEFVDAFIDGVRGGDVLEAEE